MDKLGLTKLRTDEMTKHEMHYGSNDMNLSRITIAYLLFLLWFWGIPHASLQPVLLATLQIDMRRIQRFSEHVYEFQCVT